MQDSGRATDERNRIARNSSIPHCFWFLDAPTPTSGWASQDEVVIEGWIASSITPADLRLTSDGVALDQRFERVERPDVHDRYGLPAAGFRVSVPVAQLGATVLVGARIGDRDLTIVVPPGAAPSPGNPKAGKIERILPLLRCITCSRSLKRVTGGVRCGRCRTVFAIDDKGVADFLPDDFKAQFDIVATDNVSSNSYDGLMRNLINLHPDALILDCGAGLQATTYPNVINVEIVPYESTDVLAVGEVLPFMDDTFDIVASFAVLEHVKDPFRCAAEIRRVLRPGGLLYCQVPFLQPEHGYPNHFYNMTGQGLRNLFGSMDLIEQGVLEFGQPIFALSWMLQRYADGLSPAVRERFEQLTVRELMAAPEGSLGADFVLGLANASQAELACTNFLLASKPG